MNELELSIVFATLNRAPFLRRSIASARSAAARLNYEIIVVDGGSTDETLAILEDERVTVIQQHERRGAVAAFNEGFRAAKGRYVANHNDDAEYVGFPLYNAVQELDVRPQAGQIAIPFVTCRLFHPQELAETASETCREHGIALTPKVEEVKTAQFGRVPYANFGVTRRSVGDAVDWWNGNVYYQYGGDTELSCRILAAGHEVLVLKPDLGFLVHYEVQDGTRVPNVEQQIFSERWRTRHGVFTVEHPPVTMKNPVLIHYRGSRSGKVGLQRTSKSNVYPVSAAKPIFWVDGDDVDWILNLKERGRALFERAQQEGPKA